MATIRQLLREFWIPFTLAVLWTVYDLSVAPDDRTFAVGAKTFSTAFFLFSWASGQFVRVTRQSRTDTSLGNVETRIGAITSELENATNRLVATVTGGDSFAHLSLSFMGGGAQTVTPIVLHSGEYPLSNISIRMCDLLKFPAAMASNNIFAADHMIAVGELAPGTASVEGPIPVAMPRQDWNAFFSARNGQWTQLIRGRFVGGTWLFASIVSRSVAGKNTVLLTNIDFGFPPIGEPEFDDAPRKVPPAA
ncbi:hypothetical protein SPHINGO391_500233 [Sphingomonas aurantiaca]|uniref:Uncharacterized protein n=1 Tax=Sphingomonas aurantiaca TaxID=185949 RepID=A0A5E8ABS9_9SPHN|nr:hypothetical protein SPHINGO391_500233 [Sphingomonas aurantiaca]